MIRAVSNSVIQYVTVFDLLDTKTLSLTDKTTTNNINIDKK